jgi:Cu(I)/Ag(I) efflux system membrane protein CusA/SilA
MKRIAAPMVGGMITSTVLTLVVIPAIYSLWREREIANRVWQGTGKELDTALPVEHGEVAHASR